MSREKSILHKNNVLQWNHMEFKNSQKANCTQSIKTTTYFRFNGVCMKLIVSLEIYGWKNKEAFVKYTPQRSELLFFSYPCASVSGVRVAGSAPVEQRGLLRALLEGSTLVAYWWCRGVTLIELNIPLRFVFFSLQSAKGTVSLKGHWKAVRQPKKEKKVSETLASFTGERLSHSCDNAYQQHTKTTCNTDISNACRSKRPSKEVIAVIPGIFP